MTTTTILVHRVLRMFDRQPQTMSEICPPLLTPLAQTNIMDHVCSGDGVLRFPGKAYWW